MFGIDPLLFRTIVTLPVTLISLAAHRTAQSIRRNQDERCGACGGPLYASRAWAGPSLLEGRLICEPCAAKRRRGVRRSLVAAVAITGVAVLGLAGVAIWAPSELGSHPWIPVIATVITYPAVFAGAVAWMKRANRRAAARLGLPQHPTLHASNDSTLTRSAGSVAVTGSKRAGA